MSLENTARAGNAGGLGTYLPIVSDGRNATYQLIPMEDKPNKATYQLFPLGDVLKNATYQIFPVGGTPLAN